MNTDTQKPEIVGGFNAYNEADDWMDKGEEKSDEYKEVLNLIEDYNMHNYRYIINHTKKEYVKVPAYEKDKWIIHPLPILLADGNGRGGGDYYGKNNSLAGTWKFDLISVTDDSAMIKSLTNQGYNKIKWKNEYENY
jgi:hypothetical protein